MDEITGYGIKLVKLSEPDLELVRSWRNSPNVNNFMIYQNKISKEQQIEWFKKINNNENAYYVIVNENNIKVGLINIKDIDHKKGEGEGGIFISGESEYTFTAVKASILMCNFGFVDLGLKLITCKVLNKNKKAIAYNKFSGYKFTNKNDIISYGELNFEDFKIFYNHYSKILKNL